MKEKKKREINNKELKKPATIDCPWKKANKKTQRLRQK
jgi:hypothetical protein